VNEQLLRTFWQEARQELASVDMDAHVTAVPTPLDALLQQYEVTLTSVGGVQIVGAYAVPVWPEREPLPALITFPGYGGDMPPHVALAVEAGYATLTLYPRGQGPSQAYWRVPEGFTKLTYGLADPHQHYYRAAYLDLIRGLDFLASRPEVDPHRLGVFGASQGGGLALALAALDHRVRAVAAHMPFLCAYRMAVELSPTYPYMELNDYFAQHPEQREPGLSTLEFFDPVNLAPWIEAPALLTIGDQDTVCPPATIEAVFARLRCTRALVRYPQLAHAHTFFFRRQLRQWMDLHLLS
jgi:cephalosporin-C deacetylase